MNLGKHETDMPGYFYQWRSIGGGDWEYCNKEWYNYCQKSPRHKTRIVDAGCGVMADGYGGGYECNCGLCA